MGYGVLDARNCRSQWQEEPIRALFWLLNGRKFDHGDQAKAGPSSTPAWLASASLRLHRSRIPTSNNTRTSLKWLFLQQSRRSILRQRSVKLGRSGPTCYSPILVVMITGMAVLARPVAAEIWGADCWPLRVEYNFNTGSAVISLFTENGLSIPAAAGRITYSGRNPDNSLYAYANFPGGNTLITLNINTRELFVSSDRMGGRVCVANTYVAP